MIALTRAHTAPVTLGARDPWADGGSPQGPSVGTRLLFEHVSRLVRTVEITVKAFRATGDADQEGADAQGQMRPLRLDNDGSLFPQSDPLLHRAHGPQ